MGLENRNASQLPEPGQQPDTAPISPDAPLETSLPSMMKSLTPNAPATSGDSAPQYPSLEAAVEIEQQVAPTLTNLLAAKTQVPSSLGLGAPDISVATALPGAIEAQDNSQGANPSEPKPKVASAIDAAEVGVAEVSLADAVTSQTPTGSSSPSLEDEQGLLAGQAIAVQLPDSDQPAPQAPVNNPTQNPGTDRDASWDAIAQENATADKPVEASDSAASEPVVIKSSPSGEEEAPEAAEEGPEAEELSTEDFEAKDSEAKDSEAKNSEAKNSETKDSEAKDSEARAEEVTDGEINSDVVGEEAETDNDDFDQVKAGAAEGDRAQQVLIKREDTHVAIIFPEEEASANPDVAVDFVDSQLWQDLQQRLSGGTEFASNTPVHLYSQNCLLDTRQLQELDEALGRFNLKLARIITSRRQTAVAAAMSGYSADQTNELPELLSKEVFSPQKIGLAEPLYLQKNIRSGTEIRHPGSVIVMGDLNPGSSVIADGDILVWGRLRGIAHAGSAGNKTSIVMALKLEAPQLRIAGAVARVDAQDKGNPKPEIAYISDKGIRITSAYGFNRNVLG